MKISNLHVGQELKNFKVLCGEVGCTVPKSGKAKEIITKELARYIKWTKEGRKITITEIYSEPKEKVDSRGKSEGSRGNNDKYQKDMSILIEHYLATSGQKELKIAITTLACNSNIVSMVYKKAKNDEDKCFKRLDSITNRTAFNNTMFSLSGTINNGVYGALNSLKKQGKLTYEKTHFVVIDNKVMFTTKEMDNSINEIEKQVMQEIIDKYNCDNKQLTKSNVINKPKFRKKYYDLVTKKFTKEYPKATKMFVGVIIYTFNCKKQENIIEVSNRLNDTLKDNISEKNKKQVSKVKEQYKKKSEEINCMAFGEAFVLPMEPYERDIIEYEPSYIEDTKTSINLLCGQIEQNARIAIEIKEQSKEIELSNEEINLTNEVTEGLKELPRPKFENCAFGSPISEGFGDIDEYKYCDYERTEEECITLNTVLDDLLEEILIKNWQIELNEIGFKRENITELKRELILLDKEYEKINQMIMCA